MGRRRTMRGVCAYLVAYRSLVGKVTPLGGAFEVAADPGALYLHDLAVVRRARERGVAQALVDAAGEQARAARLAHSALVCVQASREFWQKNGYAVVSVTDPRQSTHLASYGGQAHYMVKRLSD